MQNRNQVSHILNLLRKVFTAYYSFAGVASNPISNIYTMGVALRGTLIKNFDLSQSVSLTSPKTGVELIWSGCVACKRYICASSWSLCVSTRWVASL